MKWQKRFSHDPAFPVNPLGNVQGEQPPAQNSPVQDFRIRFFGGKNKETHSKINR